MVEKRESRGCKDWPAGAKGGVQAMPTARWAPRLTGDRVDPRQPLDQSAPDSCNEGESFLFLCAIDLSRALIITLGPTSTLASQGALWSFRTWGPRDARGPQFPPPASLYRRKSPCSIPAWWTSGPHCHRNSARTRPVPPALKCASSGSTPASQGLSRADPSLEPHRKGSNIHGNNGRLLGFPVALSSASPPSRSVSQAMTL